jgi:hypothetical protein
LVRVTDRATERIFSVGPESGRVRIPADPAAAADQTPPQGSAVPAPPAADLPRSRYDLDGPVNLKK